MCEDNNVVVYVPQCFDDIILSTQRALYVACKSYNLQSINQTLEQLNLEAIVDIVEYPAVDDRRTNPKKALDLINTDEVTLFLKEKKRLIFIIDQTNLIMSKSVCDERHFLTQLQRKHQSILSGSANNEVIIFLEAQSRTWKHEKKP